jgi:hypothetical protein
VDFAVVAGLILVAVVVWLALSARPEALFVIEIRNGAALTKTGKVTEAFLDEITEQCVAAGVHRGELRGIPRGRRISLAFSREFPLDLQQRLRNWWALHGWRAAARGG